MKANGHLLVRQLKRETGIGQLPPEKNQSHEFQSEKEHGLEVKGMDLTKLVQEVMDVDVDVSLLPLGQLLWTYVILLVIFCCKNNVYLCID